MGKLVLADRDVNSREYVGGQPYLPAGGHEEDSLAITERYRIR
jgi:hypothetical protein